MNILIVIVAFKSESTLPQTLRCIRDSSLGPDIELEVIVIFNDNVSTYGLDKVHLPKNTLVIEQSKNIGFAAANIAGLAASTKDHDCLIYLNPDVTFSSALLEKLITRIQKLPSERYCATPLLLRGSVDYPTKIIDSGGIVMSWPMIFKDHLSGKFLGDYYKDEIIGVCAAFMVLMDTHKSGKINLKDLTFDEEFFAYKEDIDLCLRLSNLGFKFLVFDDLIAYHYRGWKHRRSSSSVSLKYSIRGDWLLFLKHFSELGTIWTFLYLIIKSLYVQLEIFSRGFRYTLSHIFRNYF